MFGVYLESGKLNLWIRLGDQSGRIHLYQSATDNYVAYRYAYDVPARAVRLEYQSNVGRSGRVSILVQANRRAKKLLLDGVGKHFDSERIGEDMYVGLSTDWKPHQLELVLE